jgi:hypothetical protein
MAEEGDDVARSSLFGGRSTRVRKNQFAEDAVPASSTTSAKAGSEAAPAPSTTETATRASTAASAAAGSEDALRNSLFSGSSGEEGVLQRHMEAASESKGGEQGELAGDTGVMDETDVSHNIPCVGLGDVSGTC